MSSHYYEKGKPLDSVLATDVFNLSNKTFTLSSKGFIGDTNKYLDSSVAEGMWGQALALNYTTGNNTPIIGLNKSYSPLPKSEKILLSADSDSSYSKVIIDNTSIKSYKKTGSLANTYDAPARILICMQGAGGAGSYGYTWSGTLDGKDGLWASGGCGGGAGGFAIIIIKGRDLPDNYRWELTVGSGGTSAPAIADGIVGTDSILTLYNGDTQLGQILAEAGDPGGMYDSIDTSVAPIGLGGDVEIRNSSQLASYLQILHTEQGQTGRCSGAIAVNDFMHKQSGVEGDSLDISEKVLLLSTDYQIPFTSIYTSTYLGGYGATSGKASGCIAHGGGGGASYCSDVVTLITGDGSATNMYRSGGSGGCYFSSNYSARGQRGSYGAGGGGGCIVSSTTGSILNTSVNKGGSGGCGRARVYFN